MSDGPRPPRMFVGLMLDEAAGLRLEDEVERAFAGTRGLRRTRTVDLHVTLFFLGAVGESWVAPLEEDLAALDAPAPEFDLTHLGAFPRREHPRILWAGLAPPHVERVAALERRVREVCVELGFEGDARPFRPHVTLARARSGAALPADAFDAEFEIRARPAALALVESVRGEADRSYRVRRAFPTP